MRKAFTDVRIEVLEPVERGVVVFQAIGPSKIGAAMQGRVSMAMRITNHGQKAVEISRIEIMGRVVSRFPSAVVVSPDSSFYFQNCAGLDASPLIIDEPFPAAATLAVFLLSATAPVEHIVPIAPHTNDGGPLTWPGKASDLLPGEVWGASSNHPSNHQVFALDMAIWGWAGGRWSDRYPGTDGSLREHYRVYGRPVYAMSDGTIGWALNDQPEHPAIKDTTTHEISRALGRYNPSGNVVFVKSGREIALYAHLQPGSIPPELRRTGAPVKRGQYLGKVGFSGDTRVPHLHIHVKKEPVYGAPRIDVEANGCDAGAFRPMGFKDLASLTLAEAQALAAADQLDESCFARLTHHSAPNEYALLVPSASG